jgi:hypothetical protein
MMLAFVAVTLLCVLVLLLLAKYAMMDRGLDVDDSEPERIIVGSEPYVPPEVDRQIKEEMDRLQQVVIPVQYVDNGILKQIPEKASAISAALKGEAYTGPAPFAEGADGTSLDELEALPPPTFEASAIPEFEDNADGEIVPFNSIDGIIASSSEDVTALDSEVV